MYSDDLLIKRNIVELLQLRNVAWDPKIWRFKNKFESAKSNNIYLKAYLHLFMYF